MQNKNGELGQAKSATRIQRHNNNSLLWYTLTRAVKHDRSGRFPVNYSVR